MIPDNTLFLSATDTTIGFLCRDAGRLDQVKERPARKPYIRVFPSLASMQNQFRIPRRHRKRVRRVRRHTFVHPHGASFRIVDDSRHLLLLRRLGWAYSSSANLSGRTFDETYARSVADVIVEPLGMPGEPSRILKMNRRKLRRLR